MNLIEKISMKIQEKKIDEIKIEILRSPSAKYDASSSGGIVNVVLKKGVRIGLSGSVNLGANQGKYGNQFVGLNVNQGANTLSYYVNANYNRRDALEELPCVQCH